MKAADAFAHAFVNCVDPTERVPVIFSSRPAPIMPSSPGSIGRWRWRIGKSARMVGDW